MNRCTYSAVVALSMLTACGKSPAPAPELTASALAPTDLVTHDPGLHLELFDASGSVLARFESRNL